MAQNLPRDGTLIKELDDHIHVVYGGAKFYIPDPPTFQRLFGDRPVEDGATIVRLMRLTRWFRLSTSEIHSTLGSTAGVALGQIVQACEGRYSRVRLKAAIPTMSQYPADMHSTY
jgi:hypothetical protein